MIKIRKNQLATIVAIVIWAALARETVAQREIASGQLAADPTLKESLEVGLKARTPEEFEFINRVVKLVETGKLPRRLVDTTFIWAARKNAKAPFPYFKRALQIRAQKIGAPL